MCPTRLFSFYHIRNDIRWLPENIWSPSFILLNLMHHWRKYTFGYIKAEVRSSRFLTAKTFSLYFLRTLKICINSAILNLSKRGLTFFVRREGDLFMTPLLGLLRLTFFYKSWQIQHYFIGAAFHAGLCLLLFNHDVFRDQCICFDIDRFQIKKRISFLPRTGFLLILQTPGLFVLLSICCLRIPDATVWSISAKPHKKYY